jgi:hypothetical protein
MAASDNDVAEALKLKCSCSPEACSCTFRRQLPMGARRLAIVTSFGGQDSWVARAPQAYIHIGRMFVGPYSIDRVQSSVLVLVLKDGCLGRRMRGLLKDCLQLCLPGSYSSSQLNMHMYIHHSPQASSAVCSSMGVASQGIGQKRPIFAFLDL